MRRWTVGLLGFLLGTLLTVPLTAQPFPTPIAQAIALLTSGTTPFSIVGVIGEMVSPCRASHCSQLPWRWGASATGVLE